MATPNKKRLIKDYSDNVKNGYGNSHKEVFQNIINYKLKKRNYKKPLDAIKTIDTMKLLNMLYKSTHDKKWIDFNNKNLVSKLGN